VAEFENWTTSPRTAVAQDDTLAFESPLLKAALDVWRGKAAGAIPARNSLSPRDVKGFVGNLVIFERTAQCDYRIRLMGTKVSLVIGEMQGKTLEEALPTDVARRWKVALNKVRRGRRVFRIVNRVAFNNLDFLEAEILLAPLLDDAGRPEMVFGAVTFRSGVAAERSFDPGREKRTLATTPV